MAECVICKDVLLGEEKKAVTELTCHYDHSFHTECICDWIARSKGVNSTCPVCRKNIFKQQEEKEHEEEHEELIFVEFDAEDLSREIARAVEQQRLAEERRRRALTFYIRLYHDIFPLAQRNELSFLFRYLFFNYSIRNFFLTMLYIWSYLVYSGHIVTQLHPYRNGVIILERVVALLIRKNIKKTFKKLFFGIVLTFLELHFCHYVLNDTLSFHWFVTCSFNIVHIILIVKIFYFCILDKLKQISD